MSWKAAAGARLSAHLNVCCAKRRAGGSAGRNLAATCGLIACTFALLHWAAAAEDDFQPLFDGKTLEGWEGNREIFRVEGGAIVAGSLERRIPRNEFLCTTRTFGDFELRLRAKLSGAGQNAGVQFRSKRVPKSHEVEGYQCDVGRDGEKFIWGFLYDESRRRKFLVECDQAVLREAVRPDDWNDIVIHCAGNEIRIAVNGRETVSYREADESIPRQGIIGLQIHGGPPAEARYKDIRIREL